MDVRRILAIGTGIGVEIAGQALQAVLVRVRPSGAEVLASTEIAGFRSRPAGEWGLEFAEFLKREGGGHLAATVVLPRREVIVRTLNLPGVAARDLGAALQFQIDSLHPYGDEEVEYTWAKLGESSAVLAGIARRSVIDRYAQLLNEAGVKVASFTFSSACLYGAVRLFASPAGPVLAIEEDGGELEVYGESAAHPVFSAVLDLPLQRAVSLAAAELRLDPDAPASRFADILPAPKTAPAGFALSSAALAYAAALAGACPRLALPANLLPAMMRSTSSRAVFVPTVALSAVLLMLLVGMGAQGKFQDRRHLALLEAEIARLEPKAKGVAHVERATQSSQARIRLLDNFRLRTRWDLDSLNEITRLVPPPGWLNSLEMNADTVTLAGESDQAAALLKILDQSALFKNSEFLSPVGKSGSGESFRIRSAREGGPR